ncbi:hypothetical protein EON78_06715 [bacterium]|nr:MAG: hypothetical protein EON78_06715 [bacterium]
MTMIGGVPSTPIITSQPTMGSALNVSGAANITTSPLNRADGMTSTVNTGGIPAIRTNLVSRMGSSTVNVARGAVNSTVSATREFGNVLANEVLPKPEPLSSRLLRNRLLGAVVVGGFVNGVNTAVKVVRGEYTREQGVNAIIKDTGMGAITGLALSGSMGLTASTIGRFVGGVPLSMIALTIGTLTSIGVSSLVKEYIPFFSDKK